MRRRSHWLPIASILALAAFAACGSDPDPATPPVDVIPPPVAAPFGLDARPANATCLAPARPVVEAPVQLVNAFPGLTFSAPVYVAQAPGDNARFYVVEKGGAIRTFTAAATSNTQVTDFARIAVNDANEGGLLGLAFAPDFATSRFLYLSYTVTATVMNHPSNMRSKVSRARSASGLTLDAAPTVLFDVGQPYQNHNGGNIQFGADGFLYFGLGDGGSGDDPLESGQDLTTPLGKILRFDVRDTAASTYAVPADNPYASAPNSRLCSGYEPPPAPGPGAGPCREIWAYGFRNPWRYSFDRESGELWVGDVGQGAWEEIDARVQKGGNYGWRLCEGKHQRGSTSRLCTTAGLIGPIVEHPRTEARSITGGYVYRGSAIPTLRGTYVYGDYATGNIWAIVYDGAGQASSNLLTTVGMGQLTSFGEGNDGELYAVVGSEIRKLAPSGATVPIGFPEKLSATGCVLPEDPSKPAAGLIPYSLNSPLWSDGADKERFFALPDGEKISVGADGDWTFPNGTVLVKHFSLAGKRIETRLFMRHADGGWAGYSYEWNDAGTDATLLPGAKSKPVGAQVWTYPSRSQCIQCHTQAAGGALGPETANLHREAVYPSTNRVSPQLATLDHIGVLATPLPAAPVALAVPTDSAQPIEARARSYLHTNCSHCHRPEGGGQGTMDLRHALSLRDTNTCNAANTQGAIGAADKLLVPMSPETSILSLRVHATDAKRMPSVGVAIPDPAGGQVIDDYIRSLTACP